MTFESWLFRLPLLRNYDAVTLPWGVFFRQAKADVDPWLLAHEAVHVRQTARLGAFRFYLQYLCEYARGLFKHRSHEAAYRSISFEREAYGEE